MNLDKMRWPTELRTVDDHIAHGREVARLAGIYGEGDVLCTNGNPLTGPCTIEWYRFADDTHQFADVPQWACLMSPCRQRRHRR